MNIVIVGGGQKVDFLVRSLLEKKHKITVINESESDCKELAHEHETVQVFFGDGSEPSVLEEVGVQKAGLMIAITPHDATNLVICQLTRKQFGVERTFAIVNNPKNVAIFKQLGINTTVSATYMLAQAVKRMVSVHEIIHCMPIPLKDGKIQFIEFRVSTEHKICGQRLCDMRMPSHTTVSCLIRNGSFIVPNKEDTVLAEDTLLILTNSESQDTIVEALTESAGA
jgi:trk system potassium uptake protein TrkA